MKANILVVDDEPSVREALIIALEDDYTLTAVESGAEALEYMKESNVDLVLLDILMPDMDGMETLKKIGKLNDSPQVIMLTALNNVQKAVQSIKLGAFDYICKPYKIDDLKTSIDRALKVEALERENIYLRSELDKHFRSTPIIGTSRAIREFLALAEQIRESDSTVLITGESGTGKELYARYLREKSSRSRQSFVIINCPTIPESIMESELFGHEKGAFTSASERKIGMFERADTGTIFIDEVSVLSLETQTKFLRVLQEKYIERVGGQKTIPVDVRIIASTNKDLKKAKEEGTFREDLYYRLNVVPVTIPPLRERKEDIPALVDHFIRRFNEKFRKTVTGLSDEVMIVFTGYNWPGNIRELENLMERFVVLATGETIPLDMVPQDMLTTEFENAIEGIPRGLKLKDARQAFEKRYISAVLEMTDGNIQQAAKLLDVHRVTLATKIQELGIPRE